MENSKINDFVNAIAISCDENYIQEIVQNYLEYKGLIDPINIFDIFKFNVKLASPINVEDYKKMMDMLQIDYTARGPVDKPLEEVLNAVPDKISISSYELLKNTSLENSNYDNRTFKFSIAVTGEKLYVVLNILYDLAKKNEYRFHFELPPLSLQKSGATEKITLYSDITNLEDTLSFLDEALPLIKSLVVEPSHYKGVYKDVYSVDTIMNDVNYTVDSSVKKENYIKDTNMHLVSTRNKCWSEEIIGKSILEAIDDCIRYIANKQENIQIEGNFLLDYFNQSKNKLIARRKIINDIKERCIVDIRQLLVNTIQNRLQNKGINLSNAFMSREVQELLAIYLEEKKKIDGESFKSIELKKPIIEIDEMKTKDNPIAEELPPIQTVTVGYPKFFVNENISMTKPETDNIDWNNLDVNMDDYGKEQISENTLQDEQTLSPNESIIENQVESVEMEKNEKDSSIEEINDPKESEEQQKELRSIEEIRNVHSIGEYQFIEGYPDKLEEMIYDQTTGGQISYYDYFERENLLEYFPQDTTVESSENNIPRIGSIDFINRYLVPELKLNGTINLANYIKECSLKIEKGIVEKKETEEVTTINKSYTFEDYNFIEDYPQSLKSIIIDNRSNMTMKLNLYSYFESEHLLDLLPRNTIVSGDTFSNMKSEDYINKYLIRHIKLYGAINLREYLEQHKIRVADHENKITNVKYAEILEQKKENYGDYEKYAYFLQGNPQILDDKIRDFDGELISLAKYFERENLLKYFPQGAVLTNVNFDGPITSEMFINTVLIPYLMVNGAVDFQEFIENQQWNVETISAKKGLFGRLFK